MKPNLGQMPIRWLEAIRVPVAIGSRLMLTALRDSKGTAVAVSDKHMRESQVLLAASEGIFSLS